MSLKIWSKIEDWKWRIIMIFGILEFRNKGILGIRDFINFEVCDFDIWKKKDFANLWNFRNWDFWMRVYGNLGVKERGCWDLRNLLIWNFGYRSSLIFYDLGFWNYGILKIWKFEISAISKNLIVCDYDDLKFKNFKIWGFRNFEMR